MRTKMPLGFIESPAIKNLSAPIMHKNGPPLNMCTNEQISVAKAPLTKQTNHYGRKPELLNNDAGKRIAPENIYT
jgi:hypothetical protein